MGHMEHFHVWNGMPHGHHVPHEHAHNPIEDLDPLQGGELDVHPHWEALWIDIGGEG